MSNQQDLTQEYPSLAWFREHGYATEISPPAGAAGFQEVRPGRLRKVYHGRIWLYRPNKFRGYNFDMPSEKLRSPDEIAKIVDNRSLNELVRQAHDSLGQMLSRGGAGDEIAMRSFTDCVYGLVRLLQVLEKLQPDKICAIAETFDRWPVLVSRKKSDFEAAKDRVMGLGIGEKSLFPVRTGEKVNSGSFWCKLAAWAAEECQTAGILTRILNESHAARVINTKRVTIKLWDATVQATWHGLPEGIIQISDWEEQCTHLSAPITVNNVADWWHVIREFVREYWNSCRPAYQHALKLIDPKAKNEEEEWRLRNMAFDRVEQALRDLRGLPR